MPPRPRVAHPRSALLAALLAFGQPARADEPQPAPLPAATPSPPVVPVPERTPTSSPAPPVPGPAAVRVVLESRGAPLDLSRVRDDPRSTTDYLREPLCHTPCDLALPPGPLELYSSGPGLRDALFTVEVPAGGVRAHLNAGRRGPFTTGFALTLTSIALLIAGPILIAVAPPTPAAGDQTAFFAAGGAVLGAGAAVGVAGVALMLANPVGVASVEAPPPAR